LHVTLLSVALDLRTDSIVYISARKQKGNQTIYPSETGNLPQRGHPRASMIL
jgi:hypothetical protein